MQGLSPDAGASLRVLVDRNLREQAIAANCSHPYLPNMNAAGSGHPYWVDEKAGFTIQDQEQLIQFLLSLDDDPEVLPNPQIADSRLYPNSSSTLSIQEAHINE